MPTTHAMPKPTDVRVKSGLQNTCDINDLKEEHVGPTEILTVLRTISQGHVRVG